MAEGQTFAVLEREHGQKPVRLGQCVERRRVAREHEVPTQPPRVEHRERDARVGEEALEERVGGLMGSWSDRDEPCRGWRDHRVVLTGPRSPVQCPAREILDQTPPTSLPP